MGNDSNIDTTVENNDSKINNNDSSPQSIDTIDNISDSLIDSMPEVSDHVVNQHIENESKREAENGNTKDKRGDVFDPDIHAVDELGAPKFTKSGYFAKKRGRKNTETKSTIGVKAEPDQTRIKQRAAGGAAANSLIMLGIVLGGDEWQPIKNVEHGIDEKNNLENAFGDYFEQKGLDDIPAGVALTIAISGYMLPRFTMPKTRARSKSLFEKIKTWWINRKLKKHNRKVVEIEKEKADNKDK